MAHATAVALLSIAALLGSISLPAKAQNLTSPTQYSPLWPQALAPDTNAGLKLPYKGSVNSRQPAFSVTNSGSGLGMNVSANGTGLTVYASGYKSSSIVSTALGDGASAVRASATGSQSNAVEGDYAGYNVIGNGGLFQLLSTTALGSTQDTYAAINAISQSSNGSQVGYFGGAGRFVVTNPNNLDDAIYASVNGQSLAINAVNSGAGYAISAQSNGNGALVAQADRGDAYAILGISQHGYGIAGIANDGTSGHFTGGHEGRGECDYSGGPGFDCSNDRNLKRDFAAADSKAILAKLEALPEWRYRMKGNKATAWYVGPTAQDFHAAFGLGAKDTTINTANAQGVALIAIKGLAQKVDAALKAKDDEIAALEHKLALQATQLTNQNARLATLERLISGKQQVALR